MGDLVKREWVELLVWEQPLVDLKPKTQTG